MDQLKAMFDWLANIVKPSHHANDAQNKKNTNFNTKTPTDDELFTEDEDDNLPFLSGYNREVSPTLKSPCCSSVLPSPSDPQLYEKLIAENKLAMSVKEETPENHSATELKTDGSDTSSNDELLTDDEDIMVVVSSKWRFKPKPPVSSTPPPSHDNDNDKNIKTDNEDECYFETDKLLRDLEEHAVDTPAVDESVEEDDDKAMFDPSGHHNGVKRPLSPIMSASRDVKPRKNDEVPVEKEAFFYNEDPEVIVIEDDDVEMIELD